MSKGGKHYESPTSWTTGEITDRTSAELREIRCPCLEGLNGILNRGTDESQALPAPVATVARSRRRSTEPEDPTPSTSLPSSVEAPPAPCEFGDDRHRSRLMTHDDSFRVTCNL
jgi:hypothetical protein